MTVQAPPHTLTERSAVDVARAIRTGETSSREVVEAHVAVAVALELERTHGGWIPPPGPGA